MVVTVIGEGGGGGGEAGNHHGSDDVIEHYFGKVHGHTLYFLQTLSW